jgi:hypothetical protein
MVTASRAGSQNGRNELQLKLGVSIGIFVLSLLGEAMFGLLPPVNTLPIHIVKLSRFPPSQGGSSFFEYPPSSFFWANILAQESFCPLASSICCLTRSMLCNRSGRDSLCEPHMLMLFLTLRTHNLEYKPSLASLLSIFLVECMFIKLSSIFERYSDIRLCRRDNRVCGSSTFIFVRPAFPISFSIACFLYNSRFDARSRFRARADPAA